MPAIPTNTHRLAVELMLRRDRDQDQRLGGKELPKATREALDADRDGYVDVAELKSAIHRLDPAARARLDAGFGHARAVERTRDRLGWASALPGLAASWAALAAPFAAIGDLFMRRGMPGATSVLAGRVFPPAAALCLALFAGAFGVAVHAHRLRGRATDDALAAMTGSPAK